jgi:hypothetical protein
MQPRYRRRITALRPEALPSLHFNRFAGMNCTVPIKLSQLCRSKFFELVSAGQVDDYRRKDNCNSLAAGQLVT